MMRLRNLWKTVPSVSVIAMATVCSTAAYAQTEEPGEPSEGGLTEIVVTAQKRSEVLSRTAAAVAVIGQQKLDSIGATTFEDAVTTLPNVSANGLGGTIAIRGLGTNTLGAGNSTVATHIDGIFYSKLENGPAALYDIARIEVLRGPQGTLYGRNATAGVVNIITSNANTDKFEAFGDASYGSWNKYTVRGAVNVPISDSFAVRLTGGYVKSEGWQVLPAGGHPDQQDELNLRLAWRVKPTDRITWDARAAYTRESSSTPNAIPAYRYDRATGIFTASTNPIDIIALPTGTGTDGLALFGLTGLLPSAYTRIPTYEDATTRPSRRFSFRSNLNFELNDALSLTYLLGYSHFKEDKGIIANLVAYEVRYAEPSTESFWSHEIDLNYESDKLKAILGLYAYQDTYSSGAQLVRIFFDQIDANNRITYGLPALEAAETRGVGGGTSRAIFGQATFDVTDRFRVTGGARYNWDTTHFQKGIDSLCPFGSGADGLNPNVAVIGPASANLGLASFIGMPLCSAALDTTKPGFPAGALANFGFPASSFHLNATSAPRQTRSTKFTWKAGIEYDLAPDTMFYATVATGYKAGAAGNTSSSTNAAPPIRPETNINYEAGIRSRLFNNTLSLNLTAFWTEYKDQQIVSTNPNVPGQLTLVNAGSSRTRGIEFEYAWAPTSADRIEGYINYLDARFKDFRVTDDLTGIFGNYAGNRLAGAPEVSARISYAHTFDLGGAGTITPTAALYYQSKAYATFSNTAPTVIPAYTRSDLIVRYETASKRISLEGYINNIEDKQVLTSIFPAPGAGIIANSYFSLPRSYGVRLGFRY